MGVVDAVNKQIGKYIDVHYQRLSLDSFLYGYLAKYFVSFNHAEGIRMNEN